VNGGENQKNMGSRIGDIRLSKLNPKKGGNKLKKLTIMMVTVFVMISLGSVCGAGDKKGYVVKKTFNFTLNSMTGEVFCANKDIVTGCSYSLDSYFPPTLPSEYAFSHVIPIGCDPNLREEETGVAVCTGCLVGVSLYHTGSLDSDETLATFAVYAFCGK
jgi:hypothetical protein